MTAGVDDCDNHRTVRLLKIIDGKVALSRTHAVQPQMNTDTRLALCPVHLLTLVATLECSVHSLTLVATLECPGLPAWRFALTALLFCAKGYHLDVTLY